MANMAPDYLIEVRDKDFIRQGQFDNADVDLQFIEVFRGVGTWTMKVPDEHPLRPTLTQAGAGIVITQRSSGRVYSGRVRSFVLDQNAADPVGTWTITGNDDNIVAAASVVYPDPAHAANAQDAGYWVYSAAGETVMKQAVRRNVGDLAITARKYAWLTSAADTASGTLVKASVRFDVLADFLTSAGITAGLGWRFYQVGDGIEFDTFAPEDKTALIRLDIRNGGLESTQLGITAPSATEVLVMGQGEGADRTIRPVTSAGATADAALWGLRWEATKDQRNTNDPVELEQAGQEILTERGTEVPSFKVTPSDAPGVRLGVDWKLGDKITVIIAGQEGYAIVNQIATSISAAGVIQQATVGDPVGFSWEAKVTQRIKQADQRIGNLETQVESLIPVRGTTAERDSFWGVPGTTAAIAALANQRPTYYNTDLGWFEGYYAVTGTSGLTAPGLLAGATAGWYPLSGSPIYITAQRNITAQSVAAVTWNDVVFDTIRGRNAIPFTVPNSGITLPYAGDWEISAMSTVQQSAANYFNLALEINAVGIIVESGQVFPNTNTFMKSTLMPFITPVLTASAVVKLRAYPSSAGNLPTVSTVLTAKYVGPPLT